VGLIIYSKFIYETRVNAKKFKLYSLRDELNLIAMRGLVDQESDEYEFLITYLNVAIALLYKDAFSITRFLKLFIDEQLKKTNHVHDMIHRIKTNPNLEPILLSFFKIIEPVVNRDLRVLQWTLPFLAAITELISSRVFSRVLEAKAVAQRTSEKIDRYRCEILEPALDII